MLVRMLNSRVYTTWRFFIGHALTPREEGSQCWPTASHSKRRGNQGSRGALASLACARKRQGKRWHSQWGWVIFKGRLPRWTTA